jgi:hypothetical protein
VLNTITLTYIDVSKKKKQHYNDIPESVHTISDANETVVLRQAFERML